MTKFIPAKMSSCGRGWRTMTETEQLAAEYPHLLGELRYGRTMEGARDPAIGLAEAGVRRMKTWLGKDMEWMDFALLTPKRAPDDLKAMSASGTWTDDDGRTNALSDVQRKLVALPAFKRNQTMQKSLRGLGYDHWIATAGKWRSVSYGDIVEYGFFVPNAKIAKNPAGKELKDRLRPFKPSAAFKRDMLQLGHNFTQKAVIARTGGTPVLYSTFEKSGAVIKTLDKIHWGRDALARFHEILGRGGESGHTRPKAAGREGGATFLLEVCPFDIVGVKPGYKMLSIHGYWLRDMTDFEIGEEYRYFTESGG